MISLPLLVKNFYLLKSMQGMWYFLPACNIKPFKWLTRCSLEARKKIPYKEPYCCNENGTRASPTRRRVLFFFEKRNKERIFSLPFYARQRRHFGFFFLLPGFGLHEKKKRFLPCLRWRPFPISLFLSSCEIILFV